MSDEIRSLFVLYRTALVDHFLINYKYQVFTLIMRLAYNLLLSQYKVSLIYNSINKQGRTLKNKTK